ncbi:polymorphic toxin-type HINT domain-containing protein [Streptomyces kronopolitis]|uniref:polymorphic toxin-type HINT domain-containing protein n=1 Tax=Streptomyces kronopolitis TaxID=1612435 RepID=UPI0036899710
MGGTDDTADTGLTHLGAREYDPETGRFVSVDPVMNLTDSESLNGYTYAGSTPMTDSDPTGLMRPAESGSKGCDPVLCPWMDWGSKQSRRHFLNGLAAINPAKWGGYRSYPKAAVLPGLWVDSTWERSDEFTNAIYAEATSRQLFYQGMFEIDPREGSTQLTLANLKLGVCAEMEGHCPESLSQLLLSSMVNGAMTFAGSRDGGGIRAGGGRRGDTSPCHSFLPGTEVALADGKKKDIEDVTTGDRVVATDPETGKTTTRPVVATIVTKDDKHFTDLTIKTPAGEASIIATDTHPFWSADKKKWINAGDLRPGTQLRTTQGTTAKITAVRHFHKQQQTHDLTIAGTHTYYVLAGSTPVLVHNCDNAATHEVENVVDNLDDDAYFHYTSEDGHAGILSGDGSLRIGANSAGKVHVTQEIGSAVEIERNVMINNPSHAGKADFLFAFRMPQGVELGPGSQPNELIARGSLKIPAGTSSSTEGTPSDDRASRVRLLCPGGGLASRRHGVQVRAL